MTKKVSLTYESCKSAVLQARYNHHSVDGVLQLRVSLGLAVGVAQLSNEYIQENHNNHGHVSKDNQNRQPTV